MLAIALRAVSKSRGSTRVIDDVSLAAGAGSATVLIGPSGSGKSTILRLVAGSERADRGRIEIGGVDVTRTARSKRGLGYLPQPAVSRPRGTVEESILADPALAAVDAPERARRMGRVVDALEIGRLRNRAVSALSGGERRRVCLAAVMMSDAPIWLLDEPLSDIDAHLRARIARELRELQQRRGVTLVWVTSDQDEAMSMADRLVVMRNGRIEQEGAPVEVYETPASVFAAEFVGTPAMNLLGLERSGAGWIVAGTDRPVAAEQTGEGLRLGVRPEDVRLAVSQGVAVQVERVEYRGAESIVTCLLGGGRFVLSVRGRVAFRTGDPARVDWSGGAEHLFDAATGLRIRSGPEPAPGTMWA